jgi:hypothetical protein
MRCRPFQNGFDIRMMVPIPLRLRREFPAFSLTTFLVLQVLDILTTLLGLQMGAREASIFIGRLMQLGPVAALLIAKIFAVLLVTAALKFKRPRVIVFLNYWFAVVVSWNLGTILVALLTARH